MADVAVEKRYRHAINKSIHVPAGGSCQDMEQNHFDL